LRGSGQLEGETLDEITYEGYAPAGVAVFMEVVTDNRNRTVAEIRHIFNKNGGNLGENGSVAWIFNKQSLIVVDRSKVEEETLMELALGAGAEDLKEEGENWEVVSPPEAHHAVVEALDKAGIPMESAEVTRVASSTVKVEGKQAGSVIRMIEKLEEQDDVQELFANFDIDDSELEALMA
jgi:YebC/PmpR family DNA-binding regulatory protein